jgi:pSer/pThr/pTyr-binding forkhead associated (FHA) protein
MNRGTLLIKLADGRSREVPIEKSEVAIGRAPDNDLVIDDMSVSRYHVRVMIEGDRASILDALSTVGTFIGSKRVSSVTPSRLFEDQVARAGKIEIRFLPPRREAAPIIEPEVSVRSSLASLAPALSLDGPPIQLALNGPDRPIEPGALATAAMIIHNRGSVGDELSIQVNGLPDGWVRLSRDQVQLLPHDQIKIMLMFVPLPSPTLVGADYPFTVTVLSREHRTKVEVSGVLQVLARQALAVQVQPVRSPKVFRGHRKFILISVLLLALVIGGTWAYTRYCPQLSFCPSSAKASINSFTATPIELPRGGALVLSWDVTNADQVQIIQADAQTVSKNGVATYKIDRTTSFTLRATNAGGVIERTITVQVR